MVFPRLESIMISNGAILKDFFLSKRFIGLIIVLCAISFLFLMPGFKGIGPFTWSKQKLPVAVESALPRWRGPYGYFVSMGTDRLSYTEFFNSPAILLENGRVLGPGNAKHADIGQLGNGRFTFWYGTLYFSSSDNSDPRTNGREYILQIPPSLFSRVLRSLPFLLSCLCVVLVASRINAQKKSSSVIIPNRAEGPISYWLTQLYPVVFLVIPFLLYSILYYGRFSIIEDLGVIFQSDLLISLSMIPLLYLSLQINNRFGNILTLILVYLLFAIPLIAIWMNGGGNGTTFIGGFIPISDANGYYSSAEWLNQGQLLDSWGTRRPLFHGFLASLFFLAGHQWPTTLILLSIIAIFSIYFSITEIRKYFSVEAATFFILVVFVFYKRFIGTTMSENLGIILGLLSLAILIRGVFSKNKFIIVFGLFLFSLGLNARAGAFFVLPLILAWSWFCYTKDDIFLRKVFTTSLFTVALLFGFIINNLDVNLIGLPDTQIPFGNFAASFYGMIFGGNWTAYMENPALQGLASEKELWGKTFALSFAAIKSNPKLLVKGSIRAWEAFLTDGYPFIYFRNIKIRLILMVFGGWSFLLLAFTKSDIARFLLACAFGIWLSVPFVPPWDADRMRAYATTIPLLALFLGFGIQQSLGLFRSLKEGRKQKPEAPDSPVENNTWLSPLMLFSIVIVLLCFPTPIILQRVNAAVNTNNKKSNWISAEPDGRARIQTTDLSNYLNIIPDSAPYSMVPYIRKQDFLENNIPLITIYYPEFAEVLATNLKENVSFKFDPYLYSFIIIDTLSLQGEGGVFQLEDISVKKFPIIIIRNEDNLEK